MKTELKEAPSELKLYFCKRGTEWWEGGLIVAAHNEKDALDIAAHYEGDGEVFTKVTELPFVYGVVYDDEPR